MSSMVYVWIGTSVIVEVLVRKLPLKPYLRLSTELWFGMCTSHLCTVLLLSVPFVSSSSWFHLWQSTRTVSEYLIMLHAWSGGGGVLSPKLYVDVPAGPRKSDYLYTNFWPNFPPISIPFSKEKHPIWIKLGAFYNNLPKIHPIYVIWAPSSLMKTPRSLYQISRKSAPKGRHIYVYQVNVRTPPPGAWSTLLFKCWTVKIDFRVFNRKWPMVFHAYKFSIMHNFCSRLSIEVEQTVNKTLIPCYNSTVQFCFKTFIYIITLDSACKDCKVFLGTSWITSESVPLLIMILYTRKQISTAGSAPYYQMGALIATMINDVVSVRYFTIFGRASKYWRN